ncbi:MAG: TOBE domain-containing protein, partial [Hyphomicrobium sp.]|uniref:TOBE domain-containing protein n=1 Tax=Hyphomicrobium sp. TaxID=82 RepID=UPI003D0CE0FD
EALTMADRVAVLNTGRLVQIDAPERLYGTPATSFVAGFLGETTLLDVRVENGVALLAGQALRSEQRIAGSDRPHHLVLRAEKLEIAERHDQPGYNVIPAEVRELVFQGDSLLLYVEIADGRRIALRRPTAGHRSQAALQPGSAIHVALPVQETLIVPCDRDA